MKAAPPKLPRAGSGSKLAVSLFAVIFGGIAAVVFFFNPAENKFYPVCQFHRLTGLNCPGCGMTRALYALLHGNFSAALRDNALFVAGIFFLAARGAWFAWKRPATEFFPAHWLWWLLAAALVFTGLRNLPAFSFLSPA
jgi:hypothetical protein